MLIIRTGKVRTVYEEILDLEDRLEDVEFELQLPLHMLGNKLRYHFATERRNIKHKINKLKESLYEPTSNY